MRLVGRDGDAAAVTLHALELETACAAVVELGHLVLLDRSLQALHEAAVPVAEDLHEVRRAAPCLASGDPGRRPTRLVGLLRSSAPVRLRPADARLGDLVGRLGPSLPGEAAVELDRLWALGAWASALHVLADGLARAGVTLSREDEDLLLVLGDQVLTAPYHRPAARACSARPGAPGRAGWVGQAIHPPLAGRRLTYLDQQDGQACVRLEGATLLLLRDVLAAVADAVPAGSERFAGHYREGLRLLRADLDLVCGLLGAGPAGRLLWRWGAWR